MLRTASTPSQNLFVRLNALAQHNGKIASDFVFSALSQVLGRGSLILASILVANFMTAQSFAVFTFFNLTVAMIATFSTLGLGVAASRIFAETTAQLDDHKRCEARSVLLLALCSSLVAVAVLHALPNGWIQGDMVLERSAFYGSVIAITINAVLMGALSGRGDFKLMALGATAGLLVLLIGVGAAVHLENVDWAIWAVLGSMGLQVGLYYARLMPLLRRTPGTQSPVFELRSATKVLQVAGPMFVTSLLVGTVFWALGRSLVGTEGGVAEFAKYAVGLQWFSFILLVPSITTRVFFPRIVRASATESDGSRGLILTNAGANLLVSTTTGGLALLFADVLLSLYGNDQVTDAAVFRLFVLAAIVASPVNGLGNALIARDPGPRRWLLLQVGWCVVALMTALHVLEAGNAEAMAGGLLAGYLFLVPFSLLALRQAKLL